MNYADNKSENGGERSSGKGSRHSRFNTAIVMVWRQLHNKKVGDKGSNDVSADGQKASDTNMAKYAHLLGSYRLTPGKNWEDSRRL